MEDFPYLSKDDCALLIVDLQRDFCAGGALAVPGADEILPVVNRLVDNFPLVVACQDWHPANHSSFASQHQGQRPFTQITIAGVHQTLWPDHCVAGSVGAEFHPDLNSAKIAVVLRKGRQRQCDSYSAFFDNQHRYSSGLHGYLSEMRVQRLLICGLALDYCVWFSARDAAALGYKSSIYLPGCAAIAHENIANLSNEAREIGVELIGGTV